jgi:dTDP-4-dehydrorhamnose 3,5-epimerase
MIQDVEVKKLKVIKDERGFLMEMLRKDDPFFSQFGQVYMTVCNPGFVKGWHYHKKQIDHFVVVKGTARIVLYDQREDSSTHKEVQEFVIGEENPLLIKIPAFVVHGFEAAGEEPVNLINVSSEVYNYEEPDEFRIPFDDPSIPVKWKSEKGG